MELLLLPTKVCYIYSANAGCRYSAYHLNLCMAIWTLNQRGKAIHITSYLKMLDVNAMRIASNGNYRSRNLNSAHYSQKSISRSNVLCHIEIVA